MLSSGMAESNKDRPVIIRMSCNDEKQSFLEMIRFIYIGFLSTSNLAQAERAEELLRLLSVADKYGVASLVNAVCKAWAGLLADVDLLQYAAFRLPQEYHLQFPRIRKLQGGAREGLFRRFKDVRSWDVEKLGREAVVFLLSRDELEAESEDQVFVRALEWVRSTYERLEDRQEAVLELCAHLRFAHMSGEFIKDRVVEAPEMKTPAVQRYVIDGLCHAASSQSHKDITNDGRFQKRTGPNFEICFRGKLENDAAAGSSQLSPIVESHFRKWQLLVERSEPASGPTTVGVFLSICGAEDKTPVSKPTRVLAKFFARSGITGHWVQLRETVEKVFKPTETNWGFEDQFDRSWEAVCGTRLGGSLRRSLLES